MTPSAIGSAGRSAAISPIAAPSPPTASAAATTRRDARAADLPHVDNAPGERGCGGGRRTDEMGPHFRTLTMFEIAVGGGDATLSRFAAIAVAAGAHRAAGFAPEKSGIAEDAIETGGLGRAFDAGRARHDHRDHTVRDMAAAHHLGGGEEIR